MIQRYSCDPETPGPCDHGGWVLFTDAETDKAKAVAEAVEQATKELREVIGRYHQDEEDAARRLMVTRGKYDKPSEATTLSYSRVLHDIGDAQNNIDQLQKETKELRAETEDLQQKLQHMVATRRRIDASVETILEINRSTTATEPCYIPPTSLARSVMEERKKTAELRAELVRLLARPILLHTPIKGDGCYYVRKFSEDHINCERLVELEAWEAPGSTGKFVRYRPIEPRSSRGRDE